MSGEASIRLCDKARASDESRWRDALTLAGLLLVLAFAAVVRVRYTDPFASFDELWNLALSTGHGTPFGQYGTDVIDPSPRLQTSLADEYPWWMIWSSMDVVLHPPLYVVALRFWREAFGESEAAARSLSNVSSLVAIVFAFLTARLTFGRVMALLVAAAMAFSPTQVYFAQEMRPYAMMIAFGCAGLWLMTRVELVGATRGRAIALAIIPFFMLLTHYFAFGTAMGIAIFGAWRLRPHRKAFFVTLVTTALVYAVLWLPFALRQIRALSTGDSYLFVEERDWVREMIYFIGGPIRQLIDRPPDQDRILLATGVILVLPWLLLRQFPPLRPAALWLCGTLLGLLALDTARRTEHVAYVRYTSAATPAVLPVLIGCAWAYRRWAGYVVALAMTGATGIYLNANVSVAADSPGFGDLAHRVARRVGPGEAILTYRGSGLMYTGQTIQLHLSHEPGLFPRPIADLTKPMTPEMVTHLTPRTWLIIVGDPPIAIETLVPGARVVWGLGVEVGMNLYQLEIPTAGKEPSRAATTRPASSPSR